jgi:hypothetical protein
VNCWSGGVVTHIAPGPPSQPRTPPSVSFGGKHSWHRFSRGPAPIAMSQYGVAPLQSELERHWTHWLVAMLHRVAPASVHMPSLAQPGPQVLLRPSHTGPAIDDAQSAFVTHWTHWFDEVSQDGVLVPAQSAFESHCTHCCVVGSQTRAPTGQSAPVRQPTHAWLVESQMGSGPWGSHPLPPSALHAALHVCESG